MGNRRRAGTLEAVQHRCGDDRLSTVGSSVPFKRDGDLRGHAFIRLHGRNKRFWYNYLYSEDELKPGVDKVNETREKVKVLNVYFNNHYASKAVYNALKFKEMAGESLSSDEKHMLELLKDYFAGKPMPG